MKPGIVLEVDVDYGQFYVFDGAVAGNHVRSEFFDDPWLMEHRCTSIGSVGMVLTMAQHGPIPTEVVALDGDDGAADPGEWDHVVELSMPLPSGWLGVMGWELTGPVHRLDVPPGDCIVRLLWTGLDESMAADDPTREHLRIEVRPGTAAPTRVIRPWRRWVPAEYERTASNGLRLYLGGVASERKAAMTPVNLRFWGDPPATPDGSVSSLLVDPGSGTHFAAGYSDGHPMLRELTSEELAEITAAGDPYRLLFLVDERGHMWSTQLPLMRAVALQHTPAESFAMIRALGRPEDVPEPLPPGWDRIVRISMEHPEPVPVDEVGDPEPGVTYQRRRSLDSRE